MNWDDLRRARDTGKTLWHNAVGWVTIESIPLTGVAVLDQHGSRHLVMEMDLVDMGGVTPEMRANLSPVVKAPVPVPPVPRGTVLGRGKRLMKI